jgi:hypothetical protein
MALKKCPLAVRINADLPSITNVKVKLQTGNDVSYKLLSLLGDLGDRLVIADPNQPPCKPRAEFRATPAGSRAQQHTVRQAPVGNLPLELGDDDVLPWKRHG